MIRPITLLSAILFVVSGAYLFLVKHHAQMLDDQIAAVTQATRLDQQRIRVLHAQWALEADPSRLAQLSTQFTALQPMKPSQLVTLAALGSVLPAPGSAAPGPNPLDAAPVLPVPVPMPAAVASAAQPAAVQTAAVQTAAVQTAQRVVQPVRRAVVHLARAAQLPRRVDKAVVHLASADEQPRSLLGQAHMPHVRRNPAMTHEYAENRAAYSQPPLVPARPPMGAQVMSVRAVAQAAPMIAPQDDGGSLLGMAQSGSGN
ncbi:hypothetical protein [Acidocella sp.]|uniref:cell division protein FtsL n=1 Tax=Acidocella sp. TaxID=50710 RepID=UPI0026207B48|nr:hypothetical protein [Acidocella sp.]MDD2794418.1 hypothetical protein [Acidocella sp.]